MNNQTQTTRTGKDTCEYIIWKANKITMLRKQYPEWTNQEIESVVEKMEELREMTKTEHPYWNQKQVAAYTELLEKSLLTIISADGTFSGNILKDIFPDAEETDAEGESKKESKEENPKIKTGIESALRDIIMPVGDDLVRDVIVQFSYQFGKKYGFSSTDKICYEGHVLRRIIALTDFSDVKRGDVGGYVETETNLSQDGDCWIYDDAMVMDRAVVSQNAQVRGKAVVDKKAKVYENAVVKDSAHVTHRTKIYGNAIVDQYANINCNCKVYGNARVTGHAQLTRSVEVYDRAVIRDFANISCNCSFIYGDAEISGHVMIRSNVLRIFDHAKIYGNVSIIGQNDYYSKCRISGYAEIFDYAFIFVRLSSGYHISGHAKIHGYAKIISGFYENVISSVTIKDNAEVCDYAIVSHGANLRGNAKVFGNAEVSIDATVDEDAQIFGDAYVIGSNTIIKGFARIFGKAYIGEMIFEHKGKDVPKIIIDKNAIITKTNRKYVKHVPYGMKY